VTLNVTLSFELQIRSRERNGLVELPSRLRRGDRVKVRSGPFRDHMGVYLGQSAGERVAVLLSLLGGSVRVTLPKDDVAAVEQAP
jgi:transcription antitermination factor NusG